jgi:hypothetical protein
MRVLVANDPRSYREAFGRAFLILRPNVETVIVESETLDREVLRLEPDVVICDRVTPVVAAKAWAWIELRVVGETLVASSNSRALPAHARDIELDDLLDFIDENEKALARR